VRSCSLKKEGKAEGKTKAVDEGTVYNGFDGYSLG
jgi:hypothetical protein